MRKSFYVMLCLVFSVCCFAQENAEKKFKFGLGPGYSIPVSRLKQDYNGNLGINLIGLYNVTENVSFFADASGNLFRTKSGQDLDLNFPFIAGARFKYANFFAGLGLGYSIWIVNTDGFTYDVHLGYSLGSFNIVTHYTSSKDQTSSLAYFGLKLYYIF